MDWGWGVGGGGVGMQSRAGDQVQRPEEGLDVLAGGQNRWACGAESKAGKELGAGMEPVGMGGQAWWQSWMDFEEGQDWGKDC